MHPRLGDELLHALADDLAVDAVVGALSLVQELQNSRLAREAGNGLVVEQQVVVGLAFQILLVRAIILLFYRHVSAWLFAVWASNSPTVYRQR